MSWFSKPHISKKEAFKVVAIALLFSIATGLFAPAAVAISKDEITSAASAEGLSAKVKSFFTDVLEDAMARSSAVAQINPSFQSRELSKKRPQIVQNSYFLASIGQKSLVLDMDSWRKSVNETTPVAGLGSFDVQSRGP